MVTRGGRALGAGSRNALKHQAHVATRQEWFDEKVHGALHSECGLPTGFSVCKLGWNQHLPNSESAPMVF